jgi:hypothetical protein
VWLALALWALVRAVAELVPFRTVLALALPQALSLYLTALYNFAITAACGPTRSSSPGARAACRRRASGQGLFGLALDARFGLVPYVPFLLLGVAGLALPSGRRLRRPCRSRPSTT